MTAAKLNLVLAGPILRRTTPTQINLWLATCAICEVRVTLTAEHGAQQLTHLSPGQPGLTCISAGQHLHYLMISVEPDLALPTDCWISYRIELKPQGTDEWLSHAVWAPDLCYADEPNPKFCIPTHTHTLLHGSCRKPHHAGGDGLVAADTLLQQVLQHTAEVNPAQELPQWPAILVMSGDQIYADDVAGPMLSAIHMLIEQLGLPSEHLDTLQTDAPEWSDELYQSNTHYRRSQLLPKHNTRSTVLDALFHGARKPVFTSINADNHLITIGEVLAMYLLVWSPAAWQSIEVEAPAGLAEPERARFAEEQRILNNFVTHLGQVRRLLAHVPSAMIFDDHDITDDWNLNREWEEAAYEHPFSRRVIGNALIGYLLNQAWGNRPELLDQEQQDSLRESLQHPGQAHHDLFIEKLLGLEQWDFRWQTDPPLIVLDTRTRRWRSETSARIPSGLLDWEAVTDLQRGLRGLDRVLLVSAAPIFGVKLIEAIQATFSFFGKPLVVDSEYWLGHKGTASSILNVFRHRKTPKHFVVLSGDVHYSFVYDVELRGMRGGPDIWQICSSGLKNEFPPRLLGYLDHLNRWLYSPRSPLNWFTRRRNMRVIPRKPQGTPQGRRVLAGSGIGLVELDDTGAPWRIRQLLADQEQLVSFVRREDEARWD